MKDIACAYGKANIKAGFQCLPIGFAQSFAEHQSQYERCAAETEGGINVRG